LSSSRRQRRTEHGRAFADPEYAKLRPTLKLPTNSLKKVNDQIGLHPSLEGLAKLMQDQSLCIVQGVGYRIRISRISLDGHLASRQHGRNLNRAAGARAQATADAAGVSHRGPMRLLPGIGRRSGARAEHCFAGRFPVATAPQWDAGEAGATRAHGRAARPKASKSPGLLDFVQRTAVNTYASSQRLQEIARTTNPRCPIQRPLGNHLKLAAQLIDAELERESSMSRSTASIRMPTSSISMRICSGNFRIP